MSSVLQRLSSAGKSQLLKLVFGTQSLRIAVQCGLLSAFDHGKVIEKTFPEQFVLDFRGVLGIVPFGGLFGTVPELLFEKKGLIPAVQQLLVQADNT